MRSLSKTSPLETELVLDTRCLSLDVEEDLPVLRVWDPENLDREVARFALLPDAALKLAAQGLCGADANDWQRIAKGLRQRVAESRGRFVALCAAVTEPTLDPDQAGPVAPGDIADPERYAQALASGELAELAVGEGALIEARVEQAWGKPPGWLRTLSPEDREVMVRIALAARKEDR